MKKILVVDDNPEILELIEQILNLEGYEVSALLDAAFFEQQIKIFRPDLILLDVMLGRYDGRDLCNWIKSENTVSHIPIIIISATHNMSDMAGNSCSPDDFIAKPFDIDNLLSCVGQQLAA